MKVQSNFSLLSLTAVAVLLFLCSFLPFNRANAEVEIQMPTVSRHQTGPGPENIYTHLVRAVLPKYPGNGDSRIGDTHTGASPASGPITVLAVFSDRDSYRIVGTLDSPDGMPMSMMADFVELLAADKVLTAIVPRVVQRDPDNRGRAYFCLDAKPGPLSLLASAIPANIHVPTVAGDPSGERVIEISPRTVGEKLWADATTSTPIVTLFFFAGDIKVKILDTPLTKDESLPLKFYSQGPVNVSVESGDRILLFKKL